MVTIVCGRNFWPFTNKEMSCEIPPVLNKGIDAFRTFYNVKHSGRILTFRPELGNIELKAKFKERSHELSISTHAAIVLLMFEGLAEDETLSYAVSTVLPFL
jgi:cullin 3